MSDQIRASHILIAHSEGRGGSSELSREDAETRIAELKTKIEAGEDFAAAATENSDCPSASKGGDLGSFGPGAM
ncbi:MAG: peptidylprolyl isomerase, partial [Rhodospirillales bacterium]|nr:peptidylprolyl isomerase [Rhodospirillales bacterium]